MSDVFVVRDEANKQSQDNLSPLFQEKAELQSRTSPPVVLPEVIGMPPTGNDIVPSGFSSAEVAYDTMPILEIYPSEQQVVAGLELYRLRPEFEKFSDDLFKYYKVTLSKEVIQQGILRVACLNVSQPSETFTNEFSESSTAQGMLPGANDKLSEAIFMSGGTTLEESGKNISNAGGSGMLGSAMKTAGGALSDIGKKYLEEAGKAGAKGSALRMASLTAALSAGRKIDFPQIWKSSSYSASYSVSVRLYNPAPNDAYATNKFIVAPIAALLMFVVPRTNDGYTFYWPWLCQYKMKGLFDVAGGFVRSINVIKGGDDNHIAFNQRPGIVDLKIELGVLFQTMISSKNQGVSDIPALTEYLDQMSDKKTWANPSADNPDIPSWANKPGITAPPSPYSREVVEIPNKASNTAQDPQTRKPSEFRTTEQQLGAYINLLVAQK